MICTESISVSYKAIDVFGHEVCGLGPLDVEIVQTGWFMALRHLPFYVREYKRRRSVTRGWGPEGGWWHRVVKIDWRPTAMLPRRSAISSAGGLCG